MGAGVSTGESVISTAVGTGVSTASVGLGVTGGSVVAASVGAGVSGATVSAAFVGAGVSDTTVSVGAGAGVPKPDTAVGFGVSGALVVSVSEGSGVSPASGTFPPIDRVTGAFVAFTSVGPGVIGLWLGSGVEFSVGLGVVGMVSRLVVVGASGDAIGEFVGPDKGWTVETLPADGDPGIPGQRGDSESIPDTDD